MLNLHRRVACLFLYRKKSSQKPSAKFWRTKKIEESLKSARSGGNNNLKWSLKSTLLTSNFLILNFGHMDYGHMIRSFFKHVPNIFANFGQISWKSCGVFGGNFGRTINTNFVTVQFVSLVHDFFRLFPVISISQKIFSIFFLTLEQFFLTVR